MYKEKIKKRSFNIASNKNLFIQYNCYLIHTT